MTDYTPDLQPLSLGTNSKTISGRGTLNYLGQRGLYINGTAAYTFRGNVTLDRPYYYTNGQLYLSNEVAMPNQFNYATSVGYRKNNLEISATSPSSRHAAAETSAPRTRPSSPTA